MKQKAIYTILAVFFIVFSSFAQRSKQITIDLSPVVIENGKYIFNGHRVSFDAMMIPFTSLNDDNINKKIKVMNTTRDVFKIVIALPLIYLFAQSLSASQQQGSIYQSNKAMIWGTTGVIVAQSITMPIMRRGIINRYNEVVLQPTAQLLPSGFAGGFIIKF
jgi:hypothetical protein